MEPLLTLVRAVEEGREGEGRDTKIKTNYPNLL